MIPPGLKNRLARGFGDRRGVPANTDFRFSMRGVMVFDRFWLLEVRDVARTKKSELREQIRQDLIDQLERQGIYGRHYLDLVEDYMALWDTKNALIEDIKKRGVMTKYQNGQNQWGYKKNDSVGNLVKVNKQMLELLKELGLRAADFEADSDDDEEM